MTAATPKSVDVQPRELMITWNDDHVTRVSMTDLRAACPCASCVHEITGEKILDESKIAPDLFCVKAEPVGHYALAFHFSDGHATGIYSYELLRQIRPL